MSFVVFMFSENKEKASGDCKVYGRFGKQFSTMPGMTVAREEFGTEVKRLQGFVHETTQMSLLCQMLKSFCSLQLIVPHGLKSQVHKHLLLQRRARLQLLPLAWTLLLQLLVSKVIHIELILITIF